jgi:MFS family permease
MVGGGHLVEWVSWRLGFYIDASAHFIAGILVLGMGAKILFEPVQRFEYSLIRELGKSFNRFVEDLKELGILLTRDRVVQFVMLSVFVLPFVATIAYTVLVFLIQQQLGQGTRGVGWLGGIIGIGMLTGGVLMGFLGTYVNRAKLVIGSIAVLALFFIAGPFLISPFFLYAVAFVAGMVFSFVGIAQDAILQKNVHKQIRGRIFATKEFVINLTVVLCAVLIGVISYHFTPFTIIFVVGVILFGITAWALAIYAAIPHHIKTTL